MAIASMSSFCSSCFILSSACTQLRGGGKSVSERRDRQNAAMALDEFGAIVELKIFAAEWGFEIWTGVRGTQAHLFPRIPLLVQQLDECGFLLDPSLSLLVQL